MKKYCMAWASISLVFLMIAIPLGTLSASEGRKGHWAWEDNIALTRFDNGLIVSVKFETEHGCDRASLSIKGNNAISKIGLVVDDKTWTPVTAIKANHGSSIILDSSALKKLKTGSKSAVLTDRGSLVLLLHGSALAFNNAWQNCEFMLPQHLRTLEPEITPTIDSSRSGVSATGAVFFENDKNITGLGDIILFSGEIVSGDNIRLENMARKMEASNIRLASVVFVNVPGGNLATAMQIGDFIRRAGAKTAVHQVCASACIYAFSGGVVRTSYRNSRFGLHQTSYADGRPGSLMEGQKIAALRYAYLEEKGVHPKITIWESEVDPDKIRWVSQYEAKGLGLVTRIIENHDAPLAPFDRIDYSNTAQ